MLTQHFCILNVMNDVVVNISKNLGFKTFLQNIVTITIFAVF